MALPATNSRLGSAKRPANLDDLVLKALYGRMDPATRTVAPQWRSLASSLGVSQVTLGKYIHRLREEGLIEMVMPSVSDELPASVRAQGSWLPNSRKRYFINESVDANWAASVEPRFDMPAAPKRTPRRRTPKAELEAEADARMAERCRLVMADFLSRMDPATCTVAPRIKDISSRIGQKLTAPAYARVVRVFKAAGLVEPARSEGSAGGRVGDFVLRLNTAQIAGADYLKLAKTYRLKTVHAASPAPVAQLVPLAPATAPVAPLSPVAPADLGGVITGLAMENFKTSGKLKIKFSRVSSVESESGADCARVFDAMRILHAIALGDDMASAPRARASVWSPAWFGGEWPTTLSATIATPRHGELEYSVTLQRSDEKRLRVTGERLTCGAETLLLRRKHFYTLAVTGAKYGVGSSAFALRAAAGFPEAQGPIAEFARCLGSLWLLKPDPNAMRSEIGRAGAKGEEGDFSDFATCMAAQFSNGQVASAMRAALQRVCPSLTGYAVEPGEKGAPVLTVRHQGDIAPGGTPFALVDNGEKMMFLAAFVCAMNQGAAPAPVVWLAPFGWLGERERSAAKGLVRDAFSARGQMIMLG